MKTFKFKIRKYLSYIFISLSLICFISCQGQEKKTEIKKEINKPPSMDIHTASFFGNLEAINQHINAGTDLNIKDPYGSTPLVIAATFGKTDVAKALINSGADLHIKNNDGSTPLHIASFFCRTEIVKALLDKGADKTITNIYGSTPLASISTSFDEVKPIYDQMSKDLGPLGLKLDYSHLKKTRPIIADLLK